MVKSKKIYIVLTYTGTLLSKIIKFSTRGNYCHVSLALDKRLRKMYSFGRINPYIPFIGGFVHEGINIGTFKRFKNTITEIYCIEVTNKQYNIIKQEIKNIKYNKKNYKFNILGLVLAGINYKYQKKNTFYCAEFVKYLTNQANIELNLPDIVKPMDFRYKNNFVYKGLLRKYLEVIK